MLKIGYRQDVRECTLSLNPLYFDNYFEFAKCLPSCVLSNLTVKQLNLQCSLLLLRLGLLRVIWKTWDFAKYHNTKRQKEYSVTTSKNSSISKLSAKILYQTTYSQNFAFSALMVKGYQQHIT